MGATPLHYFSAGSWRAVPAGLWAANAIFTVYYNSSAGAYRIADLPDRTGVIEAFAGATAPAGTLLCYGQAISRTAFVGLFTALGTAHGTGDGSSTFNLPDLRGMVAGGKADMGGSDRGNLSGGTTLGAALGGGTHTHTISNSGMSTGGPDGQSSVDNASPAVNVASNGHSHTFSFSFPSQASSSVQPTIILNYIIRI